MLNELLATLTEEETLTEGEASPLEVAVDWEKQGRVEVDIADVSFNADMYTDVPTGFLPIMPLWTEDDEGEIEHATISVAVTNRELDVWVRNPELDVYVGGGSITVDNPSDFWP